MRRAWAGCVAGLIRLAARMRGQPLQRLRGIAAFAVVILAAAAWRSLAQPRADAGPPKSVPAAAAPKAAVDSPAALVNGVEIKTSELAAECLARHGTAVLEALVNHTIIAQACGQQGVSVTAQDVDAEIDAMAKRFNVPRDKWIGLIEQERGITPRQYSDDIVWPMIALRRLAHSAVEPTPREVQDAFDNQFGEAVKARIIVKRTQREAEQVRALALAAPDDFGGLARQHSADVASASANGWVQPVRRHSGDAGFERVVFALQPGDISPVVQVADQFIVVKCEDRLPPAEVKLADVQAHLIEDLRERKSREVSGQVFRGLQERTKVENVLNDPQQSAARPGVAALVNGQPVPLEEVRQKCLDRHGREVLEIMITRVLLGQALARAQRAVTQADIDAEVARAAEAMGFKKTDGSADVAAWFDRVVREEKIPLKHYLEDVVQPTVSLKMLVGKVPVTQEDLDKAFEATFGPRARVRVVVLDSQRRAQEVWQLARKTPTAERIGDLAEQYSVDPTTRALRGEVPPIQRNGGQPALERQAFALKPGELSGIVQIADRFMILFCEGFTEPAGVKFAEVRDELYDDIHEKKQRIEMARHFSHLRESATIDNFLAGTSQAPTDRSRTPLAGTRRGAPGPAAGPTIDPPLLGGGAGPAAAQPDPDAGRPRAGSRQGAAPPQVAVPPARQSPEPAARQAVRPPAASGVVPAGLEAPVR